MHLPRTDKLFHLARPTGKPGRFSGLGCSKLHTESCFHPYSRRKDRPQLRVQGNLCVRSRNQCKQLLRPWARQHSTLCDMGSTVGDLSILWRVPQALASSSPHRPVGSGARPHHLCCRMISLSENGLSRPEGTSRLSNRVACPPVSLHHHRWVPTPRSAHACGHTGPTGID